jgi:geranylgeranyl pyrophosphate synthase
MKPLVAEAPGLALVDILDREISPLVCGGAAPVGPAIWEQILIGLARELLARPGKCFRARLVAHAWELAGGPAGGPPVLLAPIVELIHAGSLIVDDIQDNSDTRRGAPAIHRLCGVPLALNTGNWLYFASFHLIDRCELDDAVALALHRRLSETMFRCHQGQALDLGLDVAELRQRDIPALAAAAAALKTGSLMGLAGGFGATAAGAAAPIVAALEELGAGLGTGLQQLDDLGGIRCPARIDKGIEDLAGGRLTWPWAHLARELDEVRFGHLQGELRRARQRGDHDRLIGELRTHLGEGALAAAAAPLDASLARLEPRFPGHRVLAALGAEIERLEQSYV